MSPGLSSHPMPWALLTPLSLLGSGHGWGSQDCTPYKEQEVLKAELPIYLFLSPLSPDIVVKGYTSSCVNIPPTSIFPYLSNLLHSGLYTVLMESPNSLKWLLWVPLGIHIEWRLPSFPGKSWAYEVDVWVSTVFPHLWVSSFLIET